MATFYRAKEMAMLRTCYASLADGLSLHQEKDIGILPNPPITYASDIVE